MVNMIFIDPSNGTTWFFLVFPGIGGLSLMALSMLDLLSEYIFYEEEDCYVVEKIKFSNIKKIKFLKSNFVCFQYQVEEQEETANLFLKYRKNGKIFKVSVLHVWMKKEVKNKIIRELDWHVPFR